MEVLKIVITGFLPFAGVIIGAGLQYYFSRSAESHKQLAILRTQAYIDYLRCVAESPKIGSDVQKRIDLLSRATDAKSRISIYGSAAVLSALAKFEKYGSVINSPQSADRFLSLTGVMRQESAGSNELVDLEDLRIVLFGTREWKS